MPMQSVTLRERSAILSDAQGLKGENFPRAAIVGGTISISGTVYYMLTPFRAGDRITNIHPHLTVAASGVTACKAGLYAQDATQLASSADLGTSWQSTGIKTHALSTPYIVPSDAALYIVLFHTVSTTAATIARCSAATGIWQTPSGSAPYVFAAQTGLSDLPAPGTPANSNQLGFWVGWS